MKIKDKEKRRQKLEYLIAEYERNKEDQRAINRLIVMLQDENAHLCINCVHCQQQGFLFICPIFQLPENGIVVGDFGIVYYYRKGHKPKTYWDTPKNEGDCPEYNPLIPHFSKE